MGTALDRERFRLRNTLIPIPSSLLKSFSQNLENNKTKQKNLILSLKDSGAFEDINLTFRHQVGKLTQRRKDWLEVKSLTPGDPSNTQVTMDCV